MPFLCMEQPGGGVSVCCFQKGRTGYQLEVDILTAKIAHLIGFPELIDQEIAHEMDEHMRMHDNILKVYKEDIDAIRNDTGLNKTEVIQKIKNFVMEKRSFHITEVKKLMPEFGVYSEDLNLPERDWDRNAWILESSQIKCCPTKQMALLRQYRNKRLEMLDHVQSKGQFNPSFDNTAIVKEKQSLRDLPQNMQGKDVDTIRKEAKTLLKLPG